MAEVVISQLRYLWQLGKRTFCCSCKEKKPDSKAREQGGFELLATTQPLSEYRAFKQLAKTRQLSKLKHYDLRLLITDFGNLKTSCYRDQVPNPIAPYYAPERLNGLIFGNKDIQGIVRF